MVCGAAEIMCVASKSYLLLLLLFKISIRVESRKIMMNLTINFNETNNKDMVAFSNLIAELNRLGISYDIGNNVNTVSTPVTTPVTKPVATPKTKYVATKDFKPVYEIKQLTSVDGENLYCISRKNGWTKAEKSTMNNYIKNLKGIKTIKVAYTDKNGNQKSYNAWGYNTEATAKKHFKELPTVISADELNA